MSSFVFIVVGKDDSPLYEIELGGPAQKKDAATGHLAQFIIHASLDIVQEALWTTSMMYLKVVDRFNDSFISTFVTASHVKFMLLHESRNEDGIRAFFQDVYELYLKVILNPFHDPTTQIKSTVFDNRVKHYARRHLL